MPAERVVPPLLCTTAACRRWQGEVESYGSVEAFIIPRAGELHGRPEEDAGACFVKYEMITSAAKAYEALNGRDFDGNRVVATFLPAGTIG